MGAPRKYNDSNKGEINRLGFELALLGLNEKEIAGVLGVSARTLNNWCKDYPEFLRSIREGRGLADAKVSRALFRSATGYRTVTIKLNDLNASSVNLKTNNLDKLTLNQIAEMGEIQSIEIKEHGPNGNDALKWLSNRRRHDEGINWRLNPDNEPDVDPLQDSVIEFQMMLPDGTAIPFGQQGEYIDFEEEEEE
ncbi:hypothetical protein [Gilvibacter sp.]|uniref:hypothetical protein n=1 Tax=Gilvibacter sp. TaxID=2729997 RepID=UPI0025B8AFD6|nr:hypothetical protein [Gilvibacter sp.]NQX77533.1 hypothetical protein [Gilvibacter sp.]